MKELANNPEPATFDNTIKLYDRAGAQLNDILGVFYNLTGSLNVPELQTVELESAGPLADHSAKIRTTPGLFDRVRTLYDSRETLDLDPQQLRLVERYYKDFVRAGALFDVCNPKIAIEILKLLSQQAALHGYVSFAAYQTADNMAKTPEAGTDLLERVWTPAKAAANRERDLLAKYAKSVGESEVIRAPGWRYSSEKSVPPTVSDLKAYHEDILVYEVHEEIDDQDTVRAIFLHDNFARQYKSGDAWMSEYRSQSRNVDDLGTYVIPIVVNNNNFTKGTNGEPTLLSFDDCVTLSMNLVTTLSNSHRNSWNTGSVTHKSSRNYETNEPIPAELLAKVMAARKFQQSFATVEYTDLHKLTVKELTTLDLTAFEAKRPAELGILEGIAMRHRPPPFHALVCI
ncbi:UNVERIFIED_CONTAM: hypothetical protein HDU68_004641 [Siphonaria sp. JEL0065]|nr:hypothetical protein HDU68_004641 [Siphonaria sp. JEL0065]